MDSTTGHLLIAPPNMGDPNFDGTVVYIVDHDEAGALGVVINRPTETPVALLIPELSEHVVEPDVFFEGGPVGSDQVLGIGLTGGRLEIVDLEAVISGALRPESLRLFAGYTGWAAGQLDGELAISAWIVSEATHDDVMGLERDSVWRRVLRRQGGAVGRLALYPDLLMLN